MHLSSGTLLLGERYKIIRFISAGGFGCTYEGYHVLLKKRVAIKEFFVKDFCNRDEKTSAVTVGTTSKTALVNKLKGKFVQEAQTVSSLKHPNIVNVQDIFEENGTAYYVMDYIDGPSLSDIVKREGKMSEQKALHYIRQVADALRYVHSKNRLHLDIKPGNIMVDEADNAILIDFGASKQYDEEAGENTSTLLGKTPGYAPLEQMGNDVVKFLPSTDIYALGATLYKLLTGVTPPSATMLASGEQLKPLPPYLSATTREAVLKAMQLNKNNRPQNIDQFLLLLDGKGNETENEATIYDGDGVEATAHIVVEPEVQVKPKVAAQPSQPSNKEQKANAGNQQKQAMKPVNWKLYGGIAVVVVVAFMAMFAMNKTGKESVSQTEKFTANGVDFNMVFVKGGTFTMGATPELLEGLTKDQLGLFDCSKPTHDVTLSDYYIGETEVTQALWQAVMGTNPSEFKGDTNPVENVSWDDCQAFIKKLNDATGKNFCLPTEAQWEYAARGGSQSKGYKFSGSNNVDEVAWYWQNSGDNYLQGTDDDWNWDKIEKNHSKTHAVKTKSPNELGIYDMSGNVWEWCSDWWDENYYKNSSTNNPTGPNTGSNRVRRGGSWYFDARSCRVSNRDFYTPDYRLNILGLRLALVP